MTNELQKPLEKHLEFNFPYFLLLGCWNLSGTLDTETLDSPACPLSLPQQIYARKLNQFVYVYILNNLEQFWK